MPDPVFRNALFATKWTELRLLKEQNDQAVLAVANLQTLAEAQKDIKTTLVDINKSISSMNQQDKDDVVAIYTVGFGPNGFVSEHSDAGHWVHRAWAASVKLKVPIDKPHICHIAALKDPNLANFTAALAGSRAVHDPLVRDLSDADLRRFLGLMPEVCKAIGGPNAPPAAASAP